MPLQKWLPALWLLTNCKNGISSYELARALDVTQKTAWFMLSRLRLALQSKHGGKLGGTVEVDETYIGGKSRNMHVAKRKRLGMTQANSMIGKVAVMGLLERHGKDGHSTVRLQVVEGRKRRHFVPVLDEHIAKGATVHTDSHPSYDSLSGDYIHGVIDHAEKYVDGEVHTNGCENFWSLLKRAIKGTYVSVEPFHLFRYLDEQSHRFNTRKLTDGCPFRRCPQGHHRQAPDLHCAHRLGAAANVLKSRRPNSHAAERGPLRRQSKRGRFPQDVDIAGLVL